MKGRTSVGAWLQMEVPRPGVNFSFLERDQTFDISVPKIKDWH